MMKRILLLLSALFIFLADPFSQQDSLIRMQLLKQNLEAEDLMFPDDTLDVNVVSASRSNKNPDELPITIYTITRDDILVIGLEF